MRYGTLHLSKLEYHFKYIIFSIIFFYNVDDYNLQLMLIKNPVSQNMLTAALTSCPDEGELVTQGHP